MPDHREIEVKFVLTDPAAVRAALQQLGAAFCGAHYELNIRLDDDARSLTANRRVLRLRRIESERGVTEVLTVKMPQEDADPSFSIRREIELEVSDGAALLAALEVLGYQPYWRYEKHRETFRWGAVEAVIDHLPYGWFMELEGPEEGIRELAGQLGLRLEDGLALSYAAIFDNVTRALGLEAADLTFEAFADIVVPPAAYRGEPAGR